MGDLRDETELRKTEIRACDLSDEVEGLASLCRMVAQLGDGTGRSINESDFISAMNIVSATMDRFRDEVENMVGLLSDANDKIDRLVKSTVETGTTNV